VGAIRRYPMIQMYILKHTCILFLTITLLIDVVRIC